MAERYFYSVDGSEGQGPVPLETLQQLYREGVITTSSYMCVEGATAWQPVDPALLQPPPPPPVPIGSLVVKSPWIDGPVPLILNTVAGIAVIGGAALSTLLMQRSSGGSDAVESISRQLGGLIGALLFIALVPYLISLIFKGGARIIVRTVGMIGVAFLSVLGQFANIASDAKLLKDERAMNEKIKDDARKEIASKGYIESNPEQAQQTLQKLNDQATGDSDLARGTRDLLGVMKDMLAKVKVSTDAEHACNPKVGTITGPDDIAQRRAQFEKLHDAQSGVLGFLQDFDAHCHDALAKDNFSSEFISAATVSARKNGHIDVLVTLWQTNMKVSNDYVAVLDYLAKTQDKWSAKDGKILFTDDASLAGFQDCAKQLGTDSKQVIELQKQLVQ